jgi:hypothetical protein
MRAGFRETYGAGGSRHLDRRRLDARRLLTVGTVVEIGGYRQAEKRPTVLSAQLTRDRMTARYVNAMCDTPALLHTDKKRLSGSGCPDGAFGVLADAERAHPLEVCEDLSMQQCSVAVDLEREKAISKRFRDQQVMRTCDSQPVRMRNVVCNRSNFAIRRCQKNPSRREAVGSGGICVETRHVAFPSRATARSRRYPDATSVKSAWIAGFSAPNFRNSFWVIEATNKLPSGKKALAERSTWYVGDDRNLAVQIDAEDLSRAHV